LNAFNNQAIVQGDLAVGFLTWGADPIPSGMANSLPKPLNYHFSLVSALIIRSAVFTSPLAALRSSLLSFGRSSSIA
jgi:hypothetical protein